MSTLCIIVLQIRCKMQDGTRGLLDCFSRPGVHLPDLCCEDLRGGQTAVACDATSCRNFVHLEQVQGGRDQDSDVELPIPA
jgi:hypothetical protein